VTRSPAQKAAPRKKAVAAAAAAAAKTKVVRARVLGTSRFTLFP
jgi:hypothetical protein